MKTKTVNPSTLLKTSAKLGRTIKFFTLGCKVNQYDTQSIRERFLEKGFREVSCGKNSHWCLINTCTVTQAADSKSKYTILRSIKENPKAKIIVTGCLVEKDYAKLSLLEGVHFLISKRFFPDRISDFHGRTRAFLKIQDGCNNFCSYCKVPLVRGRSRSKPIPEVIQEAKHLVENGFKEIVISGICLGAYGKDLRPQCTLVDVISFLERIEGLLRIRLSSVEAGDVTDELIEKIAHSNKLCHHLHIPIQSGDDTILERMNRSYRRNNYLALLKKIKLSVPDIGITTDVLVGFPGESEEHFNNTLQLINFIVPLRVHIFPYSQRNDTKAFGLGDNIASAITKKRMGKLKKIAEKCSRAYRKQFLGKKMKLLIESRDKDNIAFWKGYTDNYINVLLKSKQYLRNQLIEVKLNKLSSDSINASL